MSDRPTPETDALILSKDGFGATDYEWRVHSRRLERERDEAREVASGLAKQAARLRKEREKAREDATNYYARIGELENERGKCWKNQ